MCIRDSYNNEFSQKTDSDEDTHCKGSGSRLPDVLSFYNDKSSAPGQDDDKDVYKRQEIEGIIGIIPIVLKTGTFLP